MFTKTEVRFGDAIPTNDSLTCPDVKIEELKGRKKKEYRKRLIAARRYLEEGKNPLDFHLTNKDEDHFEGRTPNRKLFLYYSRMASRAYIISQSKTAPAERIIRAESMVEMFDVLAARYQTESFL